MNQCNFIGRITKELKLAQAGSATVVNFGLALNDGKKDGEKQTQFVNVAAFNKAAELITQYARKGDVISLTTRVQTRKSDMNGSAVYNTNFIVEKFEFLPNPKRETNGNVSAETNDDFAGDDIPF